MLLPFFMARLPGCFRAPHATISLILDSALQLSFMFLALQAKGATVEQKSRMVSGFREFVATVCDSS